MDHCCLEYSNDSNIRIKVSESLDSDSDSVQLQMSNKIWIRIRKKIFCRILFGYNAGCIKKNLNEGLFSTFDTTKNGALKPEYI